jgi:hypothetical protein
MSLLGVRPLSTWPIASFADGGTWIALAIRKDALGSMERRLADELEENIYKDCSHETINLKIETKWLP